MNHRLPTPSRRRCANEGFDVEVADTGRAALASAQERPPDLIVLDVMLPDLDGLEVTRRLRADGIFVPSSFSPHATRSKDKLAGLTVGGDDYVTKPFALAEIIARVRVILRRAHPDSEDDGILRFADLEMDEGAHEGPPGRPIDHFDGDRVQPAPVLHDESPTGALQAQILDHVWHYDFGGDSNVVETYVSYLRKKLERHGPPLIHTTRTGWLRTPEPRDRAATRCHCARASCLPSAWSPCSLRGGRHRHLQSLAVVPLQPIDQTLTAIRLRPPSSGPARRRGCIPSPRTPLAAGSTSGGPLPPSNKFADVFAEQRQADGTGASVRPMSRESSIRRRSPPACSGPTRRAPLPHRPSSRPRRLRRADPSSAVLVVTYPSGDQLILGQPLDATEATLHDCCLIELP